MRKCLEGEGEEGGEEWEDDEEKYEVGEKRKWEGYEVTQFNDIIFGGPVITIPVWPSLHSRLNHNAPENRI